MKGKYHCAICNVRLVEGRMVYSRWTRQRYCIDVKRHEKLRQRRARKGSA